MVPQDRGNEYSSKLVKRNWVNISRNVYYQSHFLLDKTDRKRVLVSPRDPFETKEKEEKLSQRVPRASRTELCFPKSFHTYALKAVL